MQAFLNLISLLCRPFLIKAGADPNSYTKEGKKKVDSLIQTLAEKLDIHEVSF